MKPFEFALECPKCGTINTASKFIFAKKEIECGHCKETINVEQSKLISKQCPHCEKVFIYDQSKRKNVKCPHCNQPFSANEAENVAYKMVTVNCPQCGCGVEAEKDEHDVLCPLCGNHINMAKEYAKSQLVKDNAISVIRYEGDNSTFVWKHPIEDFNQGSQLIVHETQEAIVYIDGQACGPYGEGRHTLDSENIPILKKLIDVPDNGVSPFHCEVYYINKTVQMGIRWGTPDRVRFVEPESGLPLDIGASGEMTMQVVNSRKLLVKLVGTTGGLTNRNILSTNGSDAAKGLQGFFRAPLTTYLKTYLSQTIEELGINILDIDKHLQMLSGVLQQRLLPVFEEYGLTIPNFYIAAVDLPEDNPDFRRMKELIRKLWFGKKEAAIEKELIAAQRDVVIEQGQTDIITEEIKAKQKMIQAQTEGDVIRATGYAEADVMRAKGYNEKDVMQADVQKAYAAGLGNMGSGSAGGSAMSDIVGLGIGLQAAGAMSGQIGGMFKGFMQSSENEPTATSLCPKCNKPLPQGAKFCLECGEKIVSADSIVCPQCGKVIPKGKFCPECGHKIAAGCPNCGAELAPGAKFCSECGFAMQRT